MSAWIGKSGNWFANPAKCGLNIIAAGFTNPITSTSFSATVGTSTNINDIVAKGVEWVRIPVDPTGALAATDTGTETLQIAYARDAIKRCYDKGLKVILSVHVSSSDSGWTYANIASDYPSGAKWLRYLAVLRKYSEMCKQFPGNRVALQLWNEVDSSASSANWNLMMRLAERTAKGSNRRSTLVVSGDNNSTVDGLNNLTPYGFSSRTLFAFTPYEPFGLFSLQGVTTDAVLKAISRLSYPYIPSDQTAVFANIEASSATETTATVLITNASPAVVTWTAHGLSVDDPVYFTATVALPTGITSGELYLVRVVTDANTIGLKTYTGTTVNTSSAGTGVFTGHKGNKATAKKYVKDYELTPYSTSVVDTRVNIASTWATTNKVPNRRIVATEYGCHGDFSANGATESSRANWLVEMRKRLSTKGYPQCIWHYDDDFFGVVNTGGFTLNDRFLVAMGLTSTTSYETEASTLFSNDGAVARSTYAKAVANATIKMLKDAGLWSKLDLLYLRGDTTTQQLATNWKNPGTNTITASAGSLTSAAASTGNGVVFSMNGTTDQLTCSFNTGAGNGIQNSHAAGVIRLTDDGLDSNRIDWGSSSFGELMIDTHAKSAGGYRETAFSNTATYLNTMIKHASVSRTGATTVNSYDNGSLIETITAASAGTGHAMGLGLIVVVGGQVSGMWYGSGLTDAEMALMYVILDFYEKAL